MSSPAPDTDKLLSRAEEGDKFAVEDLLSRHRVRLRRMVGLRMDPQLMARLDPSDVVQEALAEASEKLQEYIRQRPIPFYPWLRKITFEKLLDAHARHVATQKRSVRREERRLLDLSNHSADLLADQLVASGTSPSMKLERKETRERVRTALQQLAPDDREVVVLRHLEQLTLKEMAAVLAISEAATQSRYRRAIERLHIVLS